MRLRLLPLALFAALAVVALAGAGTASAKSCDAGKYPGDGYFTSLSVKGTSCAGGRTVEKHHYSCRVRNGGKDGRCNKRVDGYSCSERRNRISTEINAQVKCKKGSRRITFTYQQNL
jgi:hypothetical protein